MSEAIINWDLDPVIFWIGESIPLKYYGLFFLGGILLALNVERWIYKKEHVPVENLERLVYYVIIGIVLGARLGHCFFYEADYYLQHPIEILLPIKKIGDAYQFIGFQGLASHGGTLGVLIALAIHCKKHKVHFLWLLDRIAIVAPIVGAFIRFGNFMNSEIYGKPTNGQWGVVFLQDDSIPRHPTQLYEACSYLLIFALLFWGYRSGFFKQRGHGFVLGIAFILVFSARFVLEFFKENQVGFEEAMAFNMGQWLSVPLIGAGLVLALLKRNRF